MPSITRRRLLGGGAAVAAGAYGTYRLSRGATDAALASWTPAPGTWPLPRHDPANTAHDPAATPPREAPTVSEVASVPTADGRPRFVPVVGPDHLAAYGSGFAAYPRGGGKAVRADGTHTPLAGFGPGGRLHAVRRAASGVDAPATLVGYGADGLGETYRRPLGTDDPTGLTVGSHEVYVGDERGVLRGVDADGGRRWRVDGSMPALAGGRLYAADAPIDGTVAYARRAGLDRRLRTGPERVWSAGPADGFPRAPAVADGRVVLGTHAEGGGTVVAYDADTGDRLWAPRPLGRDVSTPALVGDRGYAAVGADDPRAGLVVALDLATGTTLWRDEVEWRARSPVVGGDTLVVAGEARPGGERSAGRVRAYDAPTGDVLWTHTFDALPGGLALAGDRVLVTAGASLYALA
ncbi:MAG: PQQ-binding-like beta-propeller repeat protein [Haloplanus sp.]